MNRRELIDGIFKGLVAGAAVPFIPHLVPSRIPTGIEMQLLATGNSAGKSRLPYDSLLWLQRVMTDQGVDYRLISPHRTKTMSMAEAKKMFPDRHSEIDAAVNNLDLVYHT